MLYIRIGEDINKRKKYDKYFQNTDVIFSFEEIDKIKENFNKDLFLNKKTIRLENWQNKIDFLLEYKKEINQSENIFLIDELYVNSNLYKKLEKLGEIFDCREEQMEINAFNLANFVAKKDKKNAWLEFIKIKDKISAEEIHGVLFWKMKTLKQKDKMFELLEAKHRAYEGESELLDEIEKFILKTCSIS